MQSYQLQDLSTYPFQAVSSVFALACGDTRPESLQARWQACQAPGRCLLGFVQDGLVLALADLIVAGGSAQLEHLAVSSPYQHQGLGRQLLTQITARLGLYRLDAMTDLSALGFYQKLGWASLELAAHPGGERRFGVWWLDSRQVLAADFAFARPPIQSLQLPGARNRDVRLLRLDLIHPLLSGNKWFKLRHNLITAQAHGYLQIVTMGGAWSNHLFATAAAGKLLGIKTQALVRGEMSAPLNPVLAFARDCDMHLIPTSRSDYRHYRTEAGLAQLQQQYPQAWIVPEGGHNRQGLAGASEIQKWVPEQIRTLVCACGTATTLAGLLLAAQPGQQMLGVSVLKGDFLKHELSQWLGSKPVGPYELETRFHAGGYARRNQALDEFMQDFAALNPGIPIEPIYTGKMLWALNSRLQHETPLPEPILAIHSGGIWPTGPVVMAPHDLSL